ncbi:MAG: glycosyltransferase family 2 protein, partial [Cyanobacteriota bacterium]|nr:glycosyltransferase family 2 protein [Cyanobacteriota bacterium]
RADLFIDGIDMDYGLRLKQNGYHNLIVPQAILEHKFGNPVKVKFFKKESFFQKYSALRHYYICRNHTYLATRYAKGWYTITSCYRRIKYMIHHILLILLHESEQKLLKIWACLKGTFDGFIGKLGKKW